MFLFKYTELLKCLSLQVAYGIYTLREISLENFILPWPFVSPNHLETCNLVVFATISHVMQHFTF